MKRALPALSFLLLFFFAACSGKPCITSNDCGGAQVCAAAHCQALSCADQYAAIDPATGICRPLPGCGAPSDVRGWASCPAPCSGFDENACIADPRCQPIYATDPAQVNQPCPAFGVGAAPAGSGTKPDSLPPLPPGCGPGPRSYLGCRPNPLPIDPCTGLDDAACRANASCELGPLTPTPACDCPPGASCLCPTVPPPVCQLKSCTALSAADCALRPDCQLPSSPTQPPVCSCPPGAACSCPNPAGTPSPPGVPALACVPRFSGCGGADETICLSRGDCHPVGSPCYCPPLSSCVCSGGHFILCEPDDGLHRCNADADCDPAERCSNDETCAPPVGGFGGGGVLHSNGGPTPPTPPTTPAPPSCAGLCVPRGCTGYGEARCNADPTCQAQYSLNCLPYGGGLPGAPAFPPCVGGAPGSKSGGIPGCGGCEPTFAGCLDANPGSVVDAGRSVLLRDPAVVDAPMFAFPEVMAKLSGQVDPAPFVEAWFAQISTSQTVAGRVADPRTQAGIFLAGAPRRPDGHLDLAALGFQTTSLSNRIDLAGSNDCGEARITFALKGGVDDRTHRMTVIVELQQPDDGANCAATARRWVVLSRLTGAALLSQVQALYAPLITPAHVNQVRTNEFLTGPMTFGPGPMPTPWELREWHLGTDGNLHLALSKQAADRTLSSTPAFTAWAQANQDAILRGVAVIPTEFLTVTSSENGSRIALEAWADPTAQVKVESALNQGACAGCHTTESTTAFAHVAERFRTTGRALISEFLRRELPKRADNLWHVARGEMTSLDRAMTARFVH